MSSLTISSTHDYLLKDGKPFFYLADMVWTTFANSSLETWRHCLAYRMVETCSLARAG